MHYVVLVLEHCPEQIQIFDLEVDDEVYQKLRKCHGHILNTVDVPKDIEDTISWVLTQMVFHEKYNPEGTWVPIYDTNTREPSLDLMLKDPLGSGQPRIVIHTGMML